MQALVERLDDERRRFPVMWGLWRAAYADARFDEARAIGETLLDEARGGADDGLVLEAHHTLWPTLTGLGLSREALAHVQAGIALYRRERHHALAALYSGHDPGVCCYTLLAMNEWIVGHPDRAVAALDNGQRLGDELGHPLSNFFVALFSAWVRFERGEAVPALAWARTVLEMCARYELTGWAVNVQVIEGAFAPELPPLEQLGQWQRDCATATAYRRTFCLLVLAEMYARHQRTDLAHGALDAIEPSERQALFASEIERVRADIALQVGDPVRAEAHARQAMAIARGREARSFELRAALALARSLQQLQREDEARSALGPLLDAFTEGLDTADPRAARALLQALA
jgi:hypothetical protein